jgi:hypothetical protein
MVPAPGTKGRPVGTVDNGPTVLPSVTATLGVATRVATVGTGVAVLPTVGTWATGLVLRDPVSKRGTLLWGPVACGRAGFLLEPLGVASNESSEVLSSSVSSDPRERLCAAPNGGEGERQDPSCLLVPSPLGWYFICWADGPQVPTVYPQSTGWSGSSVWLRWSSSGAAGSRVFPCASCSWTLAIAAM